MIKYICDHCGAEIPELSNIVQYGQSVFHKDTCWAQLDADTLRKLILPDWEPVPTPATA